MIIFRTFLTVTAAVVLPAFVFGTSDGFRSFDIVDLSGQTDSAEKLANPGLAADRDVHWRRSLREVDENQHKDGTASTARHLHASDDSDSSRQVIAKEGFDGKAKNLITGFDHKDYYDGGDQKFFGVGDLDKWPGSSVIPYAIVDSTKSDLSGHGKNEHDKEGIFGKDRDKKDEFFAIAKTDTLGSPYASWASSGDDSNDESGLESATATWEFDVGGYVDLALSIDMGGVAKSTSHSHYWSSSWTPSYSTNHGGFAWDTDITFTVEVDGCKQDAFVLKAVDNDPNFETRPMDNGNASGGGNLLKVSGDNLVTKYLAEDGEPCANQYLDKSVPEGDNKGELDTFETTITCSGETLTLTVNAAKIADEAMVFDNIEITGREGGAGSSTAATNGAPYAFATGGTTATAVATAPPDATPPEPEAKFSDDYPFGSSLTVVAEQDFDGGHMNLINDFEPADYWDGGHNSFFGVGSIEDWPQPEGLIWNLADSTVEDITGGGLYLDDKVGVFGKNRDREDRFFAIADVNDTMATWEFAIDGYTDLQLSIDMGGISTANQGSYYYNNYDYDPGFPFDTSIWFTADIDGCVEDVFLLMALDDPDFTTRPMDDGTPSGGGNLLDVFGTNLVTKYVAEDGSVSSNYYLDKSVPWGPRCGELDTFTAPITCPTGRTLKLTVHALSLKDEAMAFDNIKIFGSAGNSGDGSGPSSLAASTPTSKPTPSPTDSPTPNPTAIPTFQPSAEPTPGPTPGPTTLPTFQPSAEPTPGPTPGPTTLPTFQPSAEPTPGPTPGPTTLPTFQPSAEPTPGPTPGPTTLPTFQPSPGPTPGPTDPPTFQPSAEPTTPPTLLPTAESTTPPTLRPAAGPPSGSTSQSLAPLEDGIDLSSLTVVAREGFDGQGQNIITKFETDSNWDGGHNKFFGVGSIEDWPQEEGLPWNIADSTVVDLNGYGTNVQDKVAVFGRKRDRDDGFFAIADDTRMANTTTAIWEFDVDGYQDLHLTIDMGGISRSGYFHDSDPGFPLDTDIKFEVDVDGCKEDAFVLSPVDGAAFGTRLMDNGNMSGGGNLLEVSGVNPVTKRLAEDGTIALNQYLDKAVPSGAKSGELDTFTTAITCPTGTVLTLTLSARLAKQAVVFDNIEILGVLPPSPTAAPQLGVSKSTPTSAPSLPPTSEPTEAPSTAPTSQPTLPSAAIDAALRTLVASEDFDGNEINVIEAFDSTNNWDAGHQKFFGLGNIGNWPQSEGLPFRVADETEADLTGMGIYPTDKAGIFGKNRDPNNNFFTISDVDEPGNGVKILQATWEFDVDGYKDLQLSIDFGGVSEQPESGYLYVTHRGYPRDTDIKFVVEVEGCKEDAFVMAAVERGTMVETRLLDNGVPSGGGNLLKAIGANTVTKYLAEDGSVATNVYLDKSVAAGDRAGELDTFTTPIMCPEKSTLTLRVEAKRLFLEAMVFDNIKVTGIPI